MRRCLTDDHVPLSETNHLVHHEAYGTAYNVYPKHNSFHFQTIITFIVVLRTSFVCLSFGCRLWNGHRFSPVTIKTIRNNKTAFASCQHINSGSGLHVEFTTVHFSHHNKNTNGWNVQSSCARGLFGLCIAEHCDETETNMPYIGQDLNMAKDIPIPNWIDESETII